MARKGCVDKSIIGLRIGNYTVLDKYYQKDSVTYWLCKCDCGNEEYIPRHRIARGKMKSCNKCKPMAVRKEKLYHVYYGIKARCKNKNEPSYKKYGAKGINICKEWDDSYEVFKTWAYNNGYKEGLTIDRIDSSLGYSPDNCRWITLSENSARANIGLHKNHSKVKNMYAIDNDGHRIDIENIYKFSTEHNLNYSTVVAILHGRCKNTYHGFTFYSDRIIS